MFSSNAKPTLHNFRARLNAITEASETGLEIAQDWNPKDKQKKADVVIAFRRSHGWAKAALTSLDR